MGRRSGGPSPGGWEAGGRGRASAEGTVSKISGRARGRLGPARRRGRARPLRRRPPRRRPRPREAKGARTRRDEASPKRTEAILTIALKWSSTDTAMVRNHRRRCGEGRGRGGRACERVGGAARVTNRDVAWTLKDSRGSVEGSGSEPSRRCRRLDETSVRPGVEASVLGETQQPSTAHTASPGLLPDDFQSESRAPQEARDSSPTSTFP